MVGPTTLIDSKFELFKRVTNINSFNLSGWIGSPYVTGFTKPYVIDVIESFSFHIVTNDTDIDQIEILSVGSGLQQNGSPIDNLILFDDGNGSDETAGDNIFSTGNLMKNILLFPQDVNTLTCKNITV